ncbi:MULTISPECIES: hypothetical protein [Streptomyces]|uniref:hypothetical protein n=1 Tax=Streptomyces TaxID=1883 RepID=UPI001E375F1C|nr:MULTISPECIES: hypothetical protein [Streptomyces]UFQ16438.1 hypothetical protein J2N69_16295 [Streptomyces huasconensis]WCL86040.1 hypothetical protein PPN52_16305 [Streptomyces sp. JCM 35825]
MAEGITRWVVWYGVAGEADLRSARCVLEDGRNPLEDFPMMLAIRHGASRESADRIEVVAIRKVEDR